MTGKLKNRHSNSLIELNDLILIWKLFVKNLAIIILLPTISYFIGYIYTYRLNNVYGAKAQLLLKSNETYDYQDPIYQGLGAYSTYTDIQNQIRILQSRDLIGEVVDKLDLKVSYFVVGRLRRQEVFHTLPFTCEVTVLNQSFYELPLMIEILDAESYKLSYNLDGQSYEQIYEFETENQLNGLILNLKKQYTYDENVLDVIKESNYEIVLHSRDYLISHFQNRLKVENIDFTSVLDVYVTDLIERRATVFLDTLCNTYIDYSKRIQIEVNQNTLDNIEKQIDTVKRYIIEKEVSILNYRESNKILDINKEGDEYFADYINYTRIKRDLEEKKASVISLENYLEKSDDERVLPPYFFIEESDVFLSESVTKLRSKQNSLLIRKIQESEESLNIINLKKEINILKSDIKTYLVNLRIALEESITKTNLLIDKFQEQIKDMPKSAQDILNIQRELDVNNKMYLFLLEKKTNTLIARAGIIPQVRIIEQTMSQGVVEPNKSKIRVSFVLVGLICAFLIAIIRKLFFEKLETVAELAEVTDLSIIGGLPYVSNTLMDELVVNSQPKSQITESFRTVRTNLNYLGKNQGRAKKIAVSSFFPGEGKTFSATNLAFLIGKSDKKVLIIDFDLHKPRVHKAFKIENSKGISTLLSSNIDVKEVIVNFAENLDVITAGPLPPNPSELILKDQVKDLIQHLEQHYDFIIFDTPPFGLLHDSIELIRYVDVFVVILNARFARKTGIRHIESVLSDFENISKAVVLNGIKQRRLQYYYAKYTYKYGYSYGKYGYGYGGYGEDYSNYTD